MKRAKVRVWDPFLRILHWTLASSVIAAWWFRHGRGELHESIGYVALGAVALRVAWGFLGPPTARFARFLRRPGVTLDHLREALRGNAARYLGHNPLGGWMTVTLLATVAGIGVTGWLYTTDRFWGIAWVGNLHLWLTWGLQALVVLHLAGVAWTSRASRENLVAAMFHGAKAPPREGDPG